MAIEFRCSQCNQLLRVSDASAGKNARCPKCQTLMTVPAAGASAAAGSLPPFPSSPAPLSTPEPSAPPPFNPPPAESKDPFAFLGGGGGGGAPPPPKPPGNPFGDAQSPSPFGGPATGSVNPYASPAASDAYYNAYATASGPIRNVPVAFDPIWSHAFRVWQNNLGLLLGAMLILVGISIAVAVPIAIVQGAMEANGEQELAAVVSLVGNLVQNLVQMYLGIGQAKISVKLARGMPASIGDMFSGGPRFLPVLGGNLLVGLAFMACIVPGIIVLLFGWPFYYLIIEERAGVIDSFSLGSKITEGNRGTTFVLWMASVGVYLLGICALCLGVFVALPLISVLWATAYLMMSGQLAPPPAYGKY